MTTAWSHLPAAAGGQALLEIYSQCLCFGGIFDASGSKMMTKQRLGIYVYTVDAVRRVGFAIGVVAVSIPNLFRER